MNQHSPIPQAHEREPTRPTLELDLQKYLGQLADWNIGEAQKEEFIYTLWNLMVSCAEIGLHIHPVQMLEHDNTSPSILSADKDANLAENHTVSDEDMVYLEPYTETKTISSGEYQNREETSCK